MESATRSRFLEQVRSVSGATPHLASQAKRQAAGQGEFWGRIEWEEITRGVATPRVISG